MSNKCMQLALILVLYSYPIFGVTQKGCTVKHAYYNLVCSRFEFWCTTKYNFLTYEAICKNITLNTRSLLTLDNKERIYDIEIYSSDVAALNAGMFIDYPNIARLYLQTSNTKEIQANTFKGLSKLDWLILKNNNISVVQPKAFSGLEKLNVLNLNLNNLTELKDYTFEGLDSLQFLSLKQNKIRSIQDNTFTKLKKLGVIFLNDNLLTIITDKLFASNAALRFAWFPNNNISSFPENFFKNKKLLGEVILNNNQLTSLRYENFSGNISLNNNKLQEILPFGKLDSETADISFNNISMIPAKIFAYSNLLVSLLLNNNNIKNIHEDALRNLTKLRVLRLDFNEISELSLGLFQDLKVLNTLNISFNKIQHIESGVFTGLAYLDFLDISNNKIYAIQVSALYPLKQLKTFYFNNNNLEYLDIESLILHLANLKLINVDNNIWPCDWLSINLLKLDVKRIKIIHGTTLKTSNVHGISCNNPLSNTEKNLSPVEPVNDDKTKETSSKEEYFIQNPIEAQQSVAAKSSTGPAVYIFSVLGILMFIGVTLYVLNKYWFKRKIVIRKSQSSDTVSYKLDLVDE